MSWLRHNIRLQIGLALLLPFAVAALIPGVIAPYSPTDLVDAPFAAPSSDYWLGTDELGRDVLSRLVYAARTDLKISLGATLIAAVIGVSIGLLTGYRGGTASTVALRVTDVMLAFPSILLALFLVAVMGPSDGIVILALTILYIPGFLRFARGMAMSLRERAFVEASVISGARSRYVIWRHLLPNAIGPLLVGHRPDGRLHAPRCSDPVVSRPGHTAAGAELGQHAPGIVQLRLPGLAVRDLAGPLHRHGRSRLHARQRGHRGRSPTQRERGCRSGRRRADRNGRVDDPGGQAS